MTREEAIKHLENLKISYPFADISEWIDMAIEALNNTTDESNDTVEPTNEAVDLISRADAIEAVASEFAYKFDMTNYDTREIAEHALFSLPSADRPQGEWQSSIDDWKVCSICGQGYASRGVGLYNYCPNCGAEMRSNK